MVFLQIVSLMCLKRMGQSAMTQGYVITADVLLITARCLDYWIIGSTDPACVNITLLQPAKRCCLEVFDNDTNGPCFPTTETLRPGQRCYNGECDEKGLCISLEGVVMVRFIKFFFNKDFNAIEAMKTNVVMIVVFLTALFWIPASCYISYIDRKNAKAACEKQKAKKPASISSHEIELKKMSINKNQVEPVVDLPQNRKALGNQL
ncbi:ADAM 17-like protease isoform X2 [Pomacea canaliculata]|uniref:ADAM 17-like protease isoform X2 n=1 Tax=Pomacea canaliculata TaxID=400727 RepID=UPI000D730D7A|nr:ADAM 17-like protease isoform X2 [Pomacea canaliculata]